MMMDAEPQTGADEGDMIELLIACEKVMTWLDVLRNPSMPPLRWAPAQLQRARQQHSTAVTSSLCPLHRDCVLIGLIVTQQLTHTSSLQSQLQLTICFSRLFLEHVHVMTRQKVALMQLKAAVNKEAYAEEVSLIVSHHTLS